MKGIAYAVLFMAACGGDDTMGTTPTADAPGGVGEPPGLMGITAAHNEVRAAVDTSGIAAGPLPPMKWDPELATHAAAWTSMCIDGDGNGLVDHSSSSYRTNVAGYAYVGENVFGAGGNASGTQAVAAWASETQYFTYPSGCSGVCGHYTQIVWRGSVNLGCAIETCSNLTYRGVVLCMYGPGGNSGGPPY